MKELNLFQMNDVEEMMLTEDQWETLKRMPYSEFKAMIQIVFVEGREYQKDLDAQSVGVISPPKVTELMKREWVRNISRKQGKRSVSRQ
ncbi:MAG: hypothetical protein ITD31_04800 [Nitrosospira sp.]|nr:hypothetical protein [Nitrosospira sp.]